MGEHTKGPWRVLHDAPGLRMGDCSLGRQIWSKSGPRVAFTEGHNVGKAEEEANAFLIASAPDMAEELERANDLIAIYERDRTRHLRLIEGADTDLAELGESLGEEIERLTSVCDEQEGALRESQSLASKRFFLLQTAENQRDELDNRCEQLINERQELVEAGLVKATP